MRQKENTCFNISITIKGGGRERERERERWQQTTAWTLDAKASTNA
jgi:hypothetical protein